MVFWLQGLIFVSEKANYQGTKSLPICFFFFFSRLFFFFFRAESKQAGNKKSVWGNCHLLLHFKLLFFTLSLSTPCGMQWYLWPISEIKPLSVPITWLPLPLLFLSTMNCCTLTVYLIFCRGLAGKGHSHISLDHMAASEWSWSHCHRCRRLPLPWMNCNERRCDCPKDQLICCHVQVHLYPKVKQKRRGNLQNQPEMFASDIRLACLLDGRHVSLVWNSDSQFASAHNSLCCYKLPNVGK